MAWKLEGSVKGMFMHDFLGEGQDRNSQRAAQIR